MNEIEIYELLYKPCQDNKVKEVSKMLKGNLPYDVVSFALCFAISNKCIKTAKLLINHINFNDKLSQTRLKLAISLACEVGNLRLVKLLVKKGIDFRINDDEPFRNAVNNKHEAIIRFLLRSGVNISDNEGALIYFIDNAKVSDELKSMIACESGSAIEWDELPARARLILLERTFMEQLNEASRMRGETI